MDNTHPPIPTPLRHEIMYRFNHSLSSVLPLLLIAAGGCLHSPNQGPVTPVKQVEAIVEGDTFQVALQTWPHIAIVQGSLFADEVATVAAKVPGRVVEVHCDLGDRAEQDQVLVKLDTAEYVLQAAQAEAQLSQARSAVGLKPDEPVEKLNPLNAPPVREAAAVLDEARQAVKRLQTLFTQNAVVATDLEAAQAAATVADARYNSALNSVREKIALIGVQSAMRSLAEERLQETTIVAPFTGMVQNRSVAIGSYLNIGQPIIELVKTSVLRYRAAVPERLAASLRLGQRVRVKVLDNEIREVQITRISPTLDPVSRSLTFEALVPNEDGKLRSGSFAQAEVVLDEQSRTIAVPSSAVVRFAGVDKVWQIKDGKVTETVIQMGREEKGLIEILSGLEPGATLLVEGSTGRVGRFKGSNSEAQTADSQTVAPEAVSNKPKNSESSTAERPESQPTIKSVDADSNQVAKPVVATIRSPQNDAEPDAAKNIQGGSEEVISSATDSSESAAHGAAVQPGLGR